MGTATLMFKVWWWCLWVLPRMLGASLSVVLSYHWWPLVDNRAFQILNAFGGWFTHYVWMIGMEIIIEFFVLFQDEASCELVCNQTLQCSGFHLDTNNHQCLIHVDGTECVKLVSTAGIVHFRFIDCGKITADNPIKSLVCLIVFLIHNKCQKGKTYMLKICEYLIHPQIYCQN